MEPRDPQSLRRDLSAFADGELGPADARRLLEHLLADPASLGGLRRIQQLTTDARRAVLDHTPSPSDALQERLRQMTVPPPARPAPVANGWLPFVRATAAIALMAIGVWAGATMARRATPVAPPMANADVLPATVVAQAEEIHGVCSRLAVGLHSAGYPADVAALAASVESDLHSDHPYPDLTPIGFRYRGAGPCGRPMADTAHLLYGSLRAGSVNAVSVFVQPWHGQYPLDAGRLYAVSVAQSPFPMLAWRTDHVVYFLLADNAETDRAAIQLIRGAPATAATTGALP